MDIELITQDSDSGTTYDISELVTDVTWETQLTGQPGKLTVTYIKDSNVKLSKGSPVRFKVSGTGVFFGYIFTTSQTEKGTISFVAYDQLRYLKNKDTYVISNMTASEIFAKLCKDFTLSHNVINASNFKIADRVFDDKTLFEIIETAIDETLAYTGAWYMVRDNFGVLEFVNVNNLKTPLVLGDQSLLKTYKYETSIDTDSYNQIKLSQENTTTNKREIYIVKDSNTIRKWGTLQYTEKVDKNINPSQIAELANTLLRLKNRVTKTMSINCLGYLGVSAGSGIVLELTDLVNEEVAQNEYYLVTSATHTFKNNEHTMSLELQVSV